MSLNLYDVVFARGLGGGNGGSGGGSYKGMTIHVCASSEYDIETNIPTISEPDDQTIYLVPGDGDENNIFNEYIYVNDSWELFGSATIDLENLTVDWNNVLDKPSIQGSGDDVSVIGKLTVGEDPTNDMDVATKYYVDNGLASKQNTLTFDTTPTANSTKPVTSGGIKTALDGKQNTLTFDTTPTASSTKPVTSGGIRTALNAKQDNLTFDSTPIASSTNPVTSGGIKSALNDIEMQLTAATKSPLKASTAAAMSDTTKTYIYTGSETGYTFGNWYYYDGSSWTDGGIYNATAFETDKTLTIENMAADSKAVGVLKEALTDVSTTLTHKADKDGTVASAEQLLSDVGTEDKQPYLFRAVPYDSTRVDEEVVGCSVGWNQLVGSDTSSVTVTSGHKLYTVISGTASIVASDGTAISVTGGTDMVIDLTAWFGSAIADYAYTLEQATAGSGVAFIKALLPGGYIPYSAPGLKSVSGLSGHKFVGKNLINFSDSVVNGGSSPVDIKIQKGTYIVTFDVSDVSVGVSVQFRNEANTESIVAINAAELSGSRRYAVLTTNQDVKKFRFYTAGSVTISRVQLERDSTATDFEPYETHTYALDSDLTLRGILKMDSDHNVYADGDVYKADGTVNVRYAEVDLGSLDWTYNTTDKAASVPYFMATLSSPKYGTGMMSSKYPNTGGGRNTLTDKTMALYNMTNSPNICIADSSFTDAASFKTAMSGVKLVYEKATATTETADPYASPQNCEPGGTEEYVYTDEGSGIPVGHNSRYQKNMRGELERVSDAVPVAPSVAGTYSLKATVTAQGVTYAWVSD